VIYSAYLKLFRTIRPDKEKIVSIAFTIILINSSITLAQYKQQDFGVTFFAGYLFPGNLKTLDGELRIENNINYGLALDIRTTDDLFVEFLYNKADTEVRFKQEYYDTMKTLFNMSIEYFQAGAHVEVKQGEFSPFAAFTFGATYFKPKDDNFESDWKFSFTVGGGIKYYFTNNIGLRLQCRFLVPIYFSSASIFCNQGICNIFISGGTYILQYDLTAGWAVSF
jgi:opacity protein-like surface antigen